MKNVIKTEVNEEIKNLMDELKQRDNALKKLSNFFNNEKQKFNQTQTINLNKNE